MTNTRGGKPEDRKAFCEECDTIAELFEKLTRLKNRDLLYTLYGFAWEFKEEVMLLKGFINHLATENGPTTPFFSCFHKARTFRGGFVADIQRHYNFNITTSAVTRVTNPQPAKGWKIVPYQEKFLDGVLRVCLETGNSGEDGTHLYPDHPKILGQRYIAPYVTMQPELAFILLDENEHVCGYVASALDTKSFYHRMETEWFPSMAKIYPDQPKGDPSTWSPAENLIHEFHNPKLFFPEVLGLAFKSHLHIDLIARAQGQGLGSVMINTLLNAMKAKGSKGTFLEMSSENHKAYQFYLKFGFIELMRINDDGSKVEDVKQPNHTVILGKTL